MKKPVPKRICRDPHTVYCTAPYAHRGCCECWEYNHGDWNLPCAPRLLFDEEADV